MRILFLILILCLVACESVEDMQKKVEKNISNFSTGPVEKPAPAEEHEKPLQPVLEEIKEVPETPLDLPQKIEEIKIEEVPLQNPCSGLPKILCNQRTDCEFTLDLNTGKQYCRQRCKLYPIGECLNIGGCVIRTDRRNNSVCLANCAAFTNSDLCEMHADCGWKEENCTSLGIR